MYNDFVCCLSGGTISITIRNTLMIKRIWILLLALSLMATAAACRRGPDEPSDTEMSAPTQSSETDTETEQSTAENAEESTEAKEPEVTPPEPPSAVLVGSYFEVLTLDGTPCFEGEGDQDGHLTAADNRIALPGDANAIALSVSGWIGYDRPIDSFGFSIDGKEPTFGNFSLFTEDNVKVVGGEHALRFAIHVPLFELNPGAHTLELLARLNDGTIAKLRQTVTLQIGGLVADTSVPYHAALTHVGGAAGVNGTGSLASGMATVSGADARVGDDGRLTVDGWLATEGGVDRYVWSVDGITWYDAETNGTTGEPDGTSFSSLGYKDAAVNALFTKLTLNLSPYDGRTVDVTLGAVPRSFSDKVIPFAAVTDLSVPDQINDIVFSFKSDASVNPEGTELRASDLTDLFTINYGIGEPRNVVDLEGAPCYALSGIHEMYVSTDGRYALSSKLVHMDPSSFLFVRGYHAVISDDLLANGDPSKGQFQVHNFYETDSAGAMGGAGIYASLHDGKLTVMVKYYDPNCISRIGNHFTDVACSGSTVTMADDGTTIFIFVDGKLKVTVQLKGEVTYPDISNITPYGTFSSSAVISVVGGSTQTIRNTLVAATCQAQCGLTIRGGSVYFTDISLVPLSKSDLPGM